MRQPVYIRSQPGMISEWFGCQAGLRVVGIDSIGNVKGYGSLYSDEFIEGNLRKESLSEIWYKESNFATIELLIPVCRQAVVKVAIKELYAGVGAGEPATLPQIPNLKTLTAAIREKSVLDKGCSRGMVTLR